MLYKANPTEGSPAPLEGEAHPEDTAHAVAAIRDLLNQEQNETPVERAVPEAKPTVARLKRHVETINEPIIEPSNALIERPDTPETTKTTRKTGFQPSWRLSLVIFTMAAMIWNPWMLPIFALFMVSVGAITYFSLGPDRVHDGIARWHRRVERRNPKRAGQVRDWANRMSARLERWAGWLPARWTEGLHFPTFEEERDRFEAERDPFARLVPQERL
ncbi:MAG: hypothetical protein AB3N23_09115 [Paracoccaceae bacterium]